MKQDTVKNPILDLTIENFRQEVLENTTPILIDFWAPWCGPCRAMKPILAATAEELSGQIRVAQLNVDAEQAIAKAFNVRSIPTCLLMQGSTLLESYVGVTTAKELARKVLGRISNGGSIQ